MKASPENCFRDANVTSSCLSGSVHHATTRCTSDDWEDTAAWAPMELDFSG